MTLVADILARAARQCSVPEPPSWLATTRLEVLELRDFLEETVEDVLDRVDWPQPVSATVQITGTGAETYALPPDYKRLQRGEFAVYERLRTRRACVPVTDDGQWEYMKELGTAGAFRFYRVKGFDGSHEIDLHLPLDPGLTIVVSYVSSNWIAGGKSMFSALEDVSLLPRRILEAGTVWRFRERKGLEFGDKHAEYEALLARAINDTRTRRSIMFGGVQGRSPWDVPVPDVIPSS